jgi:hypothetical protein
MGRSKSSIYFKEGYRWCPHCDSWTVCKCGSYGTKISNPADNEEIIEGICRVCNGTGQIPL